MVVKLVNNYFNSISYQYQYKPGPKNLVQ